jgi:ABC-type multidrug transport system ATPase subunit
MNIALSGVGKKFGRTWIFKDINLDIPSGTCQVITGPNGSGKSTLLQIISGFLISDAGKIDYAVANDNVAIEKVAALCSIAAPYLELVEELTLKEHFDFHQKFRKLQNGLTTESLIALSGLERSRDKQIKVFSSGMRQRVRLLLAICSESSLLLLDEPTSNLDRNAVQWYHDLLGKYGGSRTIVVSSNHQEHDYPGFNKFFDLAL